jgi:hypothetical protein
VAPLLESVCNMRASRLSVTRRDEEDGMRGCRKSGRF